ncbi:DUF2514 family protein, partial [Pseudomonas fontis]
MISVRTIGAAVTLALVLGAFWGTYQHGRSTMSAEWRERWATRDTADKAAQAQAEATERTREQAHQQTINKVVQDGQRIIDQAFADAADARAADGLRHTPDELAGRVAAQAGSHSCTAATSAAATRAVLVLADVLKRADARAGDLAATADQSRGRGVTCEQAY